MSVKIEIYTGPMCNYCTNAKELLKNKGVNFFEIKLDIHIRNRKQ